MAVFRRTPRNLNKKHLRNIYGGVSVFNDIVDFVSHFASLGVGAFAIAGTSSSVRGTSFFFDVEDAGLILRFLLLLAIASAMGWGLGAIVSRATARQSESGGVISSIVAIFFALLLVLSANWLALSNRNTDLPVLEIMTAGGMAIAFWIAAFQFSAHAENASAGVTKQRAHSLFLFALFCPAALALTLLETL